MKPQKNIKSLKDGKTPINEIAKCEQYCLHPINIEVKTTHIDQNASISATK